MHDLTRFTQSEATECGNALRALGSAASSMETAANNIVQHLYNNVINSETTEKACALIRFYKTHPYGQLAYGLQEFASGIMGGAPESQDMKCLTMMATAGEHADWNSRSTSSGHRAIPLASADFVGGIPMIAQLVSQFGIEMGSVISPDPNVIGDLARQTFNTFHIADAVDSPCIPAQDDFVKPYGVKSVLGFGGVLSSGELFVVIMFSKVSIPASTASSFRDLSANVKEAVEPFVGGAVFA
tara:strand:- start:849 stop:1574 length:726 start_codon:yes stop_codon:yes gene_type:complete